MRYLNKKTWPFKTVITNVRCEDHDNFTRSHPDVKVMMLERNTNWHKKQYNCDVYFQKESDLIFYKLSV